MPASSYGSRGKVRTGETNAAAAKSPVSQVLKKEEQARNESEQRDPSLSLAGTYRYDGQISTAARERGRG